MAAVANRGSGVSDAAPKDDIQMPGESSSIAIIIDELADLRQTASADVEERDCITQMGRRGGRHLIVATQ